MKHTCQTLISRSLVCLVCLFLSFFHRQWDIEPASCMHAVHQVPRHGPRIAASTVCVQRHVLPRCEVGVPLASRPQPCSALHNQPPGVLVRVQVHLAAAGGDVWRQLLWQERPTNHLCCGGCAWVRHSQVLAASRRNGGAVSTAD